MTSQYRDMKKSSQKGIALITVMLMMAVMTVLAITMFNTSTVESLISHNYRTSKEAFFDADAGVHYALARIETDLNNKTIDINDLDDQNGFDLGYFDLSSLRSQGYNFEYPELLIKSANSYCFTSLGKDPGNTGARSEIEACFTLEELTHPIFSHGIVSEQKIRINGHIDMFWGSMHANGGIEQTAGGATDVVVEGSISAADSEPDINPNLQVTEGVYKTQESMDIPKITEEDFTYYENLAKSINEDNVHYSSVELSDLDLTDRVIFAFGDIDFKKCVMSNTTIVSMGNITFDNNTEWSDETVDNLIIAGENITFNGKGDAAGIFWSNGTFRHNGKNTIFGSVVTSGDFEGITDPDVFLPGNLKFDNRKSLTNDHIPLVNVATLENWTDTSLLDDQNN